MADDLEEKLDGLANELNEGSILDDASKYAESFNFGISNVLGAPVDIINTIVGLPFTAAQTLGVDVKNPFAGEPYLGGNSIRKLANKVGIGSELGDGYGHRFARIMGETALPTAAALKIGSHLATKAPIALNEMEKMLVSYYTNGLASIGVETVASSAAALGGETVKEMYPGNETAEAIGELVLGMAAPLSLTLATTAGKKLPIASVLRESFTKSGAERRAANRISDVSVNPSKAMKGIMSETELGLDPITASGDEGLMTLFKAAVNKDHKLLGKMNTLTQKSMDTARQSLLTTGNPDDAIVFLKALRMNAATKAQKSLSQLDVNASPVQAARVVRSNIEESLKVARNTENKIWGKLPNKGQINTSTIIDNFREELATRTIADDPEDIPSFVSALVGHVDGKGVFKSGAIKKHNQLSVVKTLKSRVGRAITEEAAKDAPNNNKLRLLSKMQDDIFTELSSFSDEYSDAVAFSRELNNKFTKGKIGKLLGHTKTGDVRVSPDGSIEFMLGGNKDDIRKGLRQLKQASPESMPVLEKGIKGLFLDQATNNGILNVTAAKRFLKNNAHILDEFPDIRSNINTSVGDQKLIDEWMGASLDSQLSVYQKERSAASLYLNGTPEKAMQNLVSAKNDAGQGSLMRELMSITNQDHTGKATKGLKASFGRFLIKGSVGGDLETLPGKRLTKLLADLSPAAKELYSPSELKRLNKIAAELKNIEIRNASGKAEGGIINDAPSKIISLVGGTVAARAGAQLGAGTSGASLRTASLTTSAFNSMLAKLTNDGAEQLILRAIEDPDMLKTLLSTISLETTEAAAKQFSGFLTGQAFKEVGKVGGSSGAKEKSLEQMMLELRNDLGTKNRRQATPAP